MGRGAEKKKQALVTGEATETAELRRRQLAEREEGRRTLLPKIEELYGGGGYSGEEKAAMTGAAMEAGDVGFQETLDAIRSRGGIIGNPAGGAANIREAYRERGRQKSDTARALTREFADEQQRRRDKALQMWANLYGIDTNLLGNIAGLPGQVIGQYPTGGPSAIPGLVGGLASTAMKFI